MLKLIEPGTDRILVTVEGLSRVDDPDDDYEAADVTEYIGGEDLDTASYAAPGKGMDSQPTLRAPQEARRRR